MLPRFQAPYLKSRRPREGCLYNPQEVAILNKYKEEYRNKTTHEERDLVLRTEMFVEIFNYWDRMHIPLDGPEEGRRFKVCIITAYLN